MSQENADRIRRAYEVWNESGPAAMTDQFWAEDAVYRDGPGWPDAGVSQRPCRRARPHAKPDRSAGTDQGAP